MSQCFFFYFIIHIFILFRWLRLLQKPYRKWYNKNNNLYDAFGVEKNPSTTDTNPFRYCGEYFDMESGTIYLRARYYNTSIGRFISRDFFAGKAEDPLSLNLYTYCANNPLIYVDPSGHVFCFGFDFIAGESGVMLDPSIGFQGVPTISDLPIPNIPSIPSVDIYPPTLQDSLTTEKIGVLPKEESVSQAKEAEDKKRPNTLYHYTNATGLAGILETMTINPSLSANNSKDARFGDGQYLTDIKPWTVTATQLALQLIHVPNKNKYTNYIEIDVTGLNVVKGRNGVYVIPNNEPLNVSGRIVSIGTVGKKDD